MQNRENRVLTFQKNSDLEALLSELNTSLRLSQGQLTMGDQPALPKIFILGAHRSGTTLLMQSLASSGLFAYPTNLLSRFYGAPVIGAKLQLLLTDPRYNFNNELGEFARSSDFTSANGKTTGALAPNEFWYFWRRFMPFSPIGVLSDDDIIAQYDTDTFHRELNDITRVLEKPIALKAMIANYNIGLLHRLFQDAIFIYIHRDPLSNIVSGIKARERQFGDKSVWYSFDIPEKEKLLALEPEAQVAGQIKAINENIQRGLHSIPEQQKIILKYEDFCQNPYSELYEPLIQRLSAFDYKLPLDNPKIAQLKAQTFDAQIYQSVSQQILRSYNTVYKE